jgi:hypothetical protein
LVLPIQNTKEDAMSHTHSVASKAIVKVADEAWIAAALMHRENPTETDFSVEAIVNRAKEENIVGDLRPGVYVHVLQHCVANRPPNPGRYRMLFETAPGRRRLFRPSDAYDPRREDAKTVPSKEDIPERYQPLVDWYEEWLKNPASSQRGEHPLMRAARIGRSIWKGQDPDEYVRQLREGWE